MDPQKQPHGASLPRHSGSPSSKTPRWGQQAWAVPRQDAGNKGPTKGQSRPYRPKVAAPPKLLFAIEKGSHLGGSHNDTKHSQTSDPLLGLNMASLEAAEPQPSNGTPKINGINGVNGANSVPSASLTEYSAWPSPPSEELRKTKTKIPSDFLLPNGHPDVSLHIPNDPMDAYLFRVLL